MPNNYAIDGRALTGRYTGDRTYWRNLLRMLPIFAPKDRFCVYSRLPIAYGELPVFDNLTYLVVEAANDRMWTLSALPRALRTTRPDLLHVQYTIPPACPCPVVTTIHDISFRVSPQWFPLKDRLLLNLTIPAAMRHAAKVITDSGSSREDILRAYRIPPEKVVSIPLGLPPEFAAQIEAVQIQDAVGAMNPRDSEKEETAQNRAAKQELARQNVNTRYGLTLPYVLAVGVLQPRKNLRLLARAFGKAKAQYNLPHQLVLAGKAGWQTEEEALRQEARDGAGTIVGGLDMGAAVMFPGYVDDADLPDLYRAADAFAYPSLHEGFGFPPLEAMACGTPTLVSDAPPMPHNVGKAAIVLPARDADAWAAGLGHVLTDTDLRAKLTGLGPQRASQFTWEETAARTLSIYREIVGT